MAKISLLGFYRYDNNLFEYLELNEQLDKQTLVDNILLKSADFEVIYSDLDLMKDAIALWSKKWKRTIDKWVSALSIDYNPLENYDRIEDWTDDGNSSGNTNASDNGNVENKVSAFDSSTYQPKNQNITSNSSNSNSNVDTSSTHHGRLHGNIGVTTSQQMLQSELELQKWNIYEEITMLFLSEFVIPIY